MKQQATVVMAEGKLMAEIIRPEACSKCRACSYGQKEHMLVPLPEGDFKAGDSVELELSESTFSRATLIAYAFPLAMFLIGLFAASLLTDSEIAMAIAAFASLGIGLLVIRLTEPRLKKSGNYMPAVRKCRAATVEEKTNTPPKEEL